MSTAFVFTPDLCTGCEACRVACGNENAGGRDTGWRQVTTFNPERDPALPTRHLSLACNHCEEPTCARGCPARAFDRDAATGALLLDEAKCMGCRYCSWVCPYDAPRFDAERGVMTKCTFCAHRLEQGLAPACVTACPTGALATAPRSTVPGEPAFHGLGAFGLRPSLVVVPPRRHTPPEGVVADDDIAPPTFPPRTRKITLRSEMGLLVFTLLLPALAAWFAGGVRHPERAPGLLAFVALAAFAFALSTSHLGRPLRAWRAVLGLSTSWLSREVTAAGLFVGLGAATLALSPTPTGLGVAALAAALLLVVAMDRVYVAMPRAAGPRLHGAETTTAFLLLAGLAADLRWLAVAAAVVKIALLIRRGWAGGVEDGTWGFRTEVRARPRNKTLKRGAPLGGPWLGRAGALSPGHLVPPMPTWVATSRLVLLATAFGPWPWATAFCLALAAEAIDRAAFYAGLEPSTPASRMEQEMIG